VRVAIALACLLLATSAQAETNQERVRNWFRPPPTVPLPTPAPQPKAKPEIKPTPVPESPKVVPKLKPPKQADRSKPRKKQQETPKQLEPLSGGGQRSPPPETGGFCFFPISCATVCEYARAGDSRRGTACQNRLGMACVKSTCPDVLRKKS
jgi:hypothetical protein